MYSARCEWSLNQPSVIEITDDHKPGIPILLCVYNIYTY